jgi:hypothetical protein
MSVVRDFSPLGDSAQNGVAGVDEGAAAAGVADEASQAFSAIVTVTATLDRRLAEDSDSTSTMTG